MLLHDAFNDFSRAGRARAGTRSRAIVAAAWFAIALPFAQGCVDARTSDGGGATGELVLPLRQSGDHGELFHLASATFEVMASDGEVTSVDGDSGQDVLTLQLPPGSTDAPVIVRPTAVAGLRSSVVASAGRRRAIPAARSPIARHRGAAAPAGGRIRWQWRPRECAAATRPAGWPYELG